MSNHITQMAMGFRSIRSMFGSYFQYSAWSIYIGFSVLLFVAPLEAGEQTSIRFASERGFEIYERDKAAWLATDAALASGLRQTSARGWISVRTETGWLVRFVASCDGAPCSVLDVNLKNDRPTTNLLDPPEPLPVQQRNAWSARQLALSERISMCSDRYNTVVVPIEDGRWAVYLLAATLDPKAVLLGGHHRFTISANGNEILDRRAFSKSCLTLEKQANAGALMATHLLDPHPVETHVFASLQHNVTIYVSTKNGLFVVEGKSIRK